jgi:putative toxin-antitoxin system antitoxin component (TIGR02293 family)
MLTNYDARAVAEVMGLAFSRSAKDNHDFVIQVDDASMLMVEIEAKSDLVSDFESGLVSSPTAVFIEKAVERGLPRTTLRHVAEWLAGGDKARVSSLEWGVVPKTTLERRETQLSPAESEKTERVARLSVHARRALGTEAEARAFMTTPHPELDGRSPLGAARTDLGTSRVEQILTALEYGLAL